MYNVQNFYISKEIIGDICGIICQWKHPQTEKKMVAQVNDNVRNLVL